MVRVEAAEVRMPGVRAEDAEGDDVGEATARESVENNEPRGREDDWFPCR